MDKNSRKDDEINWTAGQCSAYRSQWQSHPPCAPMAAVNSLGPMAGLQALCAACTRIYPEQPNPLQVTARVKYWLGGPDPLDYISMYWNSGSVELGVPPHWHYVSFGLSDLHGDGRVHPPPIMGASDEEKISGFGLELSFRVIAEAGRPPLWPATLLQRLATYVFNTGNRFCAGDHVSWHSALDGSDDEILANKNAPAKTKIRHILIADDPQLGTVNTPLGKVQFLQVVGVTDRELKAAKKAGGAPVLEVLNQENKWFVTDLNRKHSVRLPHIMHTPSELSGVAAICRWEYWAPNIDAINPPETASKSDRESSELSQDIKDEIKCVLQKGLTEINVVKDTSSIKPERSESSSKCAEKSDPLLASDCKMSTDSVKFGLVGDCFKFPSALKSNLSLSGSLQKDLIMSTDSFEMSKIGIALMEDLKELDDSKSNASLNDATAELDGKDKDSNAESDRSISKTEKINPSEVQPKSTANRCECESRRPHTNDCDKCQIANAPSTQQGVVQQVPGVHLIFNREAGNVLPLALRCRILHGRHFTWQAAIGDGQAITLVASGVSGAMVSREKPMVAYNGWLQILITDEFAVEMARDLEVLLENDTDDSDEESESKVLNQPPSAEPLTFTWPRAGLKITVFLGV